MDDVSVFSTKWTGLQILLVHPQCCLKLSLCSLSFSLLAAQFSFHDFSLGLIPQASDGFPPLPECPFQPQLPAKRRLVVLRKKIITYLLCAPTVNSFFSCCWHLWLLAFFTQVPCSQECHCSSKKTSSSDYVWLLAVHCLHWSGFLVCSLACFCFFINDIFLDSLKISYA